jgi:hypothetical protein
VREGRHGAGGAGCEERKAPLRQNFDAEAMQRLFCGAARLHARRCKRPHSRIQRVRSDPRGSRLRLEWADSPRHAAESGSLSCGRLVRFRLLPTPPRGDAVAFRFIRCDLLWHGLSPH